MRNNHDTKVTAWILAIILGICAIIPAAMAGEYVKFEMLDTDFSINDSAAYSITYTDGSTITTDPAALTPGKEYTMLVSANEVAGGTPFVTEGYMVLELPLEISNVVSKTGSNENGTVGWGYSPKYNTLDFHWTGEKKDSFSAEFTVSAGKIYPLYNIAQIGSLYYRLAKTEISATKAPGTLPGGKVDESLYKTKEYDFTGLDITVDGITYVYADENFKQDLTNPVPYYTAEQKDGKGIVGVTVVYNKIGGGAGWLVDESYHYDDPNNTTGFHRDFQIKLHDAPQEQILYNFLKINKIATYYKLKSTKIVANPVKNYGNNSRPKEDEYILIPAEDYDFTDVVLSVDGKEYRYREKKPAKDEKYENYYTVVPDGVRVKDKIHENDAWFSNPESYLDVSMEAYDVSVNATKAYHRDYLATTFDGNTTFYNVNMYDGEQRIATIRKPEQEVPALQTPVKDGYTFTGWKLADGTDYSDAPLAGDLDLYAGWTAETEHDGLKVSISSDVPEGTKVYPGTEITLFAQLTGFENKNYKLQWQYTTDQDLGNANWIDVENANGETYTYTIDYSNANYTWRVVAFDITDKE